MSSLAEDPPAGVAFVYEDDRRVTARHTQTGVASFGASEIFDELRSASYITNRGAQGIELNNSEFGELADVLVNECEWEPFEIKSRLKHYEGWSQHDWT